MDSAGAETVLAEGAAPSEAAAQQDVEPTEGNPPEDVE
jgi:hypothetical protein